VFKELNGVGRVLGVAFRPGCFRPFLRRPVRSITDRSIPAAEVIRDLPDQAELGYADQAHFVRDFTKMFGESPTRYAERY
ncbi:MAG: DUF6597 domain-containing transcriptional factor, partial [Egibacteraceae bacterium]